MIAPSESEFWDTVLEDAPEQYEDRVLGWSTCYSGIGHLGWGLYLTQREREVSQGVEDYSVDSLRADIRNMREAYRIAGTIGSSIRIVDDILDGHSTEQIPQEDIPELRPNYIHSVKNGAVPEGPDHELATTAYRSGREINGIIEGPEMEEDIEQRLWMMGRIVETEDKSNLRDYKRALEADSAGYTELIIDGLQAIPEFNPDDELYRFGHEFGRCYGINDDLLDQDVPIENAELERLRDEAVENIREIDGTLPHLTGVLGDKPEIYEAMLKIGVAQDKIANLKQKF